MPNLPQTAAAPLRNRPVNVFLGGATQKIVVVPPSQRDFSLAQAHSWQTVQDFASVCAQLTPTEPEPKVAPPPLTHLSVFLLARVADDTTDVERKLRRARTGSEVVHV